MPQLNKTCKLTPGFQYIDKEEIRLPGIKKIILTGDLGCTGFYEESKEILGQILGQKSDSFFFLGDLAFIGTEEEFREIIDFCNQRVRVPIFALCGNHDVLHYNEFLGSSSYAIVLDSFVCVFLNNSAGFFSDRDIDFLGKKLNEHKRRNFILFMHVPPPTDIERSHLTEAEWRKVRRVLEHHRERVRHIFCAHIHGFHNFYLDGYSVTISAGGGAAMIHELKRPEQKLHHAVALNLHDNGEVSTEFIIIQGSLSANTGGTCL